MVNIQQKNKLVRLLKSIGDTSYSEGSLINELSREIEKLKQSIPENVDLSPINNDIAFLKSRDNSLGQAISNLTDTISKVEKEIISKIPEDKSQEVKKEIEKELDELKSYIKKVERDSRSKGGGAMHRQIALNGTVVATQYADVNLIASGATASTNNTTKKTDITLVSGGSPASPSGSIQFNNSGAFGGSSNFTFDGTNTTLLGYIWDKGRNKVFTQIVAPTGNSSTVGGLMMGCGSTAYITPQFSGTIKVMTTGNLNAPSSSGGQAAVNAWYGTGTAPTNGAAETGTRYGDQRFVKNSSATVFVQRDFAYLTEITGLSIGTKYWFDISINRYATGTASANNISFYLEETP